MRHLNLLLALLAGASIAATAGQAQTPQTQSQSQSYALLAVTPVPAMPEGDFDQLAADLSRNRLYVSAEAGGGLDVFDLRTGALLTSGGPVDSPHKVAVDAKTHRVWVADGADGSIKVLDENLGLVARIPVGAKPDTGVIDPAARLFYVSSRNGAADGPGSLVNAISLDSFTVVRSFAVPSTTLKGMILDKDRRRLLVSLREKNQIAVIHLRNGRVELWSPAQLHMNVPLALDAKDGLLFVGSRKPGGLQVLDPATGALRQTLPSTETSDSMSFDAAHGTLYVSGDTGMSRYQVGPDHAVQLVSTDPALDGKTSLYVPELNRLYVMRRKSETAPAALQVFEPKSE
jgi:DNA-binding beta-propeller fold protein YncE